MPTLDDLVTQYGFTEDEVRALFETLVQAIRGQTMGGATVTDASVRPGRHAVKRHIFYIMDWDGEDADTATEALLFGSPLGGRVFRRPP